MDDNITYILYYINYKKDGLRFYYGLSSIGSYTIGHSTASRKRPLTKITTCKQYRIPINNITVTILNEINTTIPVQNNGSNKWQSPPRDLVCFLRSGHMQKDAVHSEQLFGRSDVLLKAAHTAKWLCAERTTVSSRQSEIWNASWVRTGFTKGVGRSEHVKSQNTSHSPGMRDERGRRGQHAHKAPPPASRPWRKQNRDIPNTNKSKWNNKFAMHTSEQTLWYMIHTSE